MNTHLTFRIPLRHSLDLPAEQWWYAYDAAEYPDERDHEYGPRRRPLLKVVDGLRDGPVPVQGDQAQVHDGRGAQEHVQGGVYVAPPVAEYPVAHQLVGQRERHDDYAQEEVSHGQAGDEPVLHVLQRLLRDDGNDYQHVADHDHDHEHDDHDRCDHDLRHRVRGRVHRFEYVVRPVWVQRAVGVVQVTGGAVLVHEQPELVLVDFEHHSRQAGQVLGGRFQGHHGRWLLRANGRS